MRYKIDEVRDRIKVGMKVVTNGSGRSIFENLHNSIIISGEIGEVSKGNNEFYIWQNERNGSQGTLSPRTRGYEFSWSVSLNNHKAWIEFIDEDKEIKSNKVINLYTKK